MGWIYYRDMDTNYGRHGYEIRVNGHLDQYWCAWFEGWTITNLENGEALFRRTNVEQPQVHSALNKIWNLNLTLLSVTRVSKDK